MFKKRKFGKKEQGGEKKISVSLVPKSNTFLVSFLCLGFEKAKRNTHGTLFFLLC